MVLMADEFKENLSINTLQKEREFIRDIMSYRFLICYITPSAQKLWWHFEIVNSFQYNSLRIQNFLG